MNFFLDYFLFHDKLKEIYLNEQFYSYEKTVLIDLSVKILSTFSSRIFKLIIEGYVPSP